MGQFLPYAVTVFDDGRHRTVGEYRALEAACMVARLSLQHRTITLAVVKTLDGRMVFACDSTGEWAEAYDDARSGEFRDVLDPECGEVVPIDTI